MSGDPNSREGLWLRFGNALAKSRDRFTTGLANVILGKPIIDQSVMGDLETALLIADVGVATTQQIIEQLATQVKRRQLRDSNALLTALSSALEGHAIGLEKTFELKHGQPSVVLVVGVNGVGKTTSIGKLAHLLQKQGKSVLLAAGDTYRAAAIEQLTTWGNRIDAPVVKQRQGSDSASVIFDAISAAQARTVDVVLADTAGRLQTKQGLMDELAKVKRVIQKIDESAPHEVLMVLDATVGQNVLSQVKEFHESVGLTGLVVTKLDGTAKAGFIFALKEQFNLPLYFVGLGEGLEDLHPFDGTAFVHGLLSP